MAARWKWLVGISLVAVALVWAATSLVDEPLRRLTEGEMNARLDGYTVHIGELDFHPLGFSVDFRDVALVQDAHPEQPVLRIPRLFTSVQWKALLRGRLVADIEVDEPVLRVDRTQLLREVDDATPIEERGWQSAVRAMYPLKINAVAIHDGSMSYVDSEHARPLSLSAIHAVAQDIRNTQAEPGAYPSPVRIEAVVFEEGRLLLEGDLDFLRTPHAAVKGRLRLERITLDYFDAVAARYGFSLDAGTLAGTAALEYAPDVKVVQLERVQVDGLRGNWTWDEQTAAPVRHAAEATADAARDVSNEAGLLLQVERAEIHAAEVGFVNKRMEPPYRVFLGSSELVLENLSNQRREGVATARIEGRFMDSGPAIVAATFRPETDGPDFDVDVRVLSTDLETLNDLLRAHADVDVVSGDFSLYSELHVKAGRVEGYVKPLFRNLEVYAPGQDRKEPLGTKLKEKAAELIADALRNRPREEVATVVPISGPVDDPDASTWWTLVGLVENAFFKAVLPGFERERTTRR